MKRLTAALLLALGVCWAGAASADEESFLDCLRCCDCCQFNCVRVDIDCNCECDMASMPLRVEFLDCDGNVLGAGEVPADWCSDCRCDTEWTFTLDNTVNADDVGSIRLVKGDDDPGYFWMSVHILCDDPCDCGDWCKIWKGDVCGWSPVPEMAPPPPPPAPPAPTPPAPPAPPKPPAPRPTPPPPPPTPPIPPPGPHMG